MTTNQVQTEAANSDVSLERTAVLAQIKLDLYVKNVSYQNTKLIKILAGSDTNSSEAKKAAAKFAREELGASIVSVGGGRIAVVARPKPKTT